MAVLTSYTTGYDSDGSVGDNAGSEYKNAQGFIIVPGGTIVSVDLYLKDGPTAPTDDITIRIETDNAGVPSGNLADANATGTIAAAGIPAGYDWITCTFGTPFYLSGNVQYHLIASIAAQSNDVRFDWGRDQTSPAYVNGTASYSQDGGAWNNYGADLLFRVNGTGETTSTSSSTSTTTTTSTSTTTTTTSTSTTVTTSTSTSITTTSTSTTTTLPNTCVIDQQDTSPNLQINFGDATGTLFDYGQTFKPSVNAEICNIAVKVGKTGSPTDNLKCEIYSTTAGKLPDVLLATADYQITGSSLSTTPAIVNFQFLNTSTILFSALTYAVVISRTGSYNNTNLYCFDYGLESYAGGNELIRDISGWSISTGIDTYFKEYYDNTTEFTTTTSTSSSTSTTTTTTSTSTTTTTTSTSTSSSSSTSTSTLDVYNIFIDDIKREISVDREQKSINIDLY